MTMHPSSQHSADRHDVIRVQGASGGTFEDNDLRDNGRGAWDVAPDCAPNVTRTGNAE